jgi:tRNA threonylcarbamoyladenosine biosynthesis protein TsaB
LKLLTIETSGKTCGFAVSENGQLQSFRILGDRSALSQRIIGLIDETLKQAGRNVHQLNGIAVSLGPGSWTGLRIGVTTAKVFAQALGVPLVGVPTFDAVARSLSPCGRLVVVAPCRKGEVYAAVFDSEGHKVEAEHVVKTEDLIAQLREETNVTLCGDSVDELKTILGKRAKVVENFAQQALVGATAIAHERLVQDNADDLFAVKPIYLALSQAERVMGIQIE